MTSEPSRPQHPRDQFSGPSCILYRSSMVLSCWCSCHCLPRVGVSSMHCQTCAITPSDHGLSGLWMWAPLSLHPGTALASPHTHCHTFAPPLLLASVSSGMDFTVAEVWKDSLGKFLQTSLPRPQTLKRFLLRSCRFQSAQFLARAPWG